MKLILVILCGLLSVGAYGQSSGLVERQGEVPEIGVERTATVGSVVLENYRFIGRPGVRIGAPVTAKWGAAEAVDLVAGDGLAIIREKKLKACKQFRVIMGMSGWDDCLIDMDDDGKFDRVSFNNVGGSKDLVPAIPYERAMVEVKGEPGQSPLPSFRKQLIYAGSSGSVLNLSYREYSDDLARPAFTESLSLPIGENFPQKVAVKDYVLELISLDGMGLRYKRIK